MDILGAGLILAARATPHDLSIFHPESPAGSAIANLSILVLVITSGILLIVGGVLMYCVLRFRTTSVDGIEPPQVYGSIPIEVAWTAAPAMIVFILILVTTRTLWEVEIPKPSSTPGDDALFVTVVGRQWWWEYQYEQYNGKELAFVTANELHMPVSESGRPRRVHLTLKSDDVCHSFWVPRLGGKTDLIPGRVSTMWLQTERPGLYLGQCAEFCGEQHANMLLRVVAESPDAFDAWLEKEAASAKTTSTEAVAQGRELFQKLSCVNCHSVRGTSADGTNGPDLTHVMRRATLASGQIVNSPENLRSWIADPQKIKRGSLMPNFGLSQLQLDHIMAYLESLD